jgi:hypothetical protein
MMIDDFGEARQRDLIAQSNDVKLPYAEGEAVPNWIRRLVESGIGFLWIEAGMPNEMASRLSHLFHTMFDLLQGVVEEENDLLERIDQNLNAAEPNFSHARIIANILLAQAIYEGDANGAARAAERVRDILLGWKNEEGDWGRDYELEEVSWIIEHANEIGDWSGQVRNRVELIQTQ